MSTDTEDIDNPWLTEVKMDDHKTVFKIDTGTDVTALSYTLYGKGQQNKYLKTH